MSDPDLLDSLQKANAELTAALNRYADLHRAHNALQHEHEALKAERAGKVTKAPTVVHCSALIAKADEFVPCTSVLELRPLYQSDLDTLIRLAQWTTVDGQRRCAKCSGGER